ncbi:MAG: tetratricopeptide repeat protein [Chlorobium sp.]
MKSSNTRFYIALAGFLFMAYPSKSFGFGFGFGVNSGASGESNPATSANSNKKAPEPSGDKVTDQITPTVQKESGQKADNTLKQPTPASAISMAAFRSGTLNRVETSKLADACIAAGEFKKAEEVFATLLVWYPTNQTILKKAIKAYELAWDAEKALPLYDILLKRKSIDNQFIINAARAYLWTNRYSESVKLFERAFLTGGKNLDNLLDYSKALFGNKQYSLAVEAYGELLQKHGLPKKSALDFIGSLESAQQKREAEKLLELVDKQFPETPKKVLLEDQFKNSLAEELKKNYEVLKTSPHDEPALLGVARRKSWLGDYPSALASYDSIIAWRKPADETGSLVAAYREKARVLGWMAKYDDATAQYERAIDTFPHVAVLKSEYKAKRENYRNSYRPAVRAYKEWMQAEANELEPQLSEPQFDLGQLYMQHAKWKEANDIYSSMLVAQPAHLQAAMAKQKADILASKTSWRTGTEYFTIDSEWKNINVTVNSYYTSLSHALDGHLTAFVNLETKSYRFDTLFKDQIQKSIVTALEYRNTPDLLVRAAYGFHSNSDTLDDTNTGSLVTESEPLNNLHLALGLNREDVIDNAKSFQHRIQKNRWQSRAVYDGDRNWNAGIDYEFADYSDGNASHTTGADVTAHLLFGTQQLNLTYRLQKYGFTKTGKYDYWTPDTYTTNSLGLEWRHYFNKEIFIGAKDTYSTLQCRVNFEPDEKVSHQIRAALYRDWSSRFSTSIEGQYSWATIAFYQDKLLKAEIRWLF